MTTVRGNTARINLTSSFGGTAMAQLTLRGGILYWQILRSEGEEYYPTSAVLRRVRGRMKAAVR